MKLNIDTPVNFGDTLYHLQKFGLLDKLSFDNIGDFVVDGFFVDKNGISVYDNSGDCWGNINNLDKELSEVDFMGIYSTRSKAEQAVLDWNREIIDSHYTKERDLYG